MSVQKTYALILGIVLTLVGLAGFIPALVSGTGGMGQLLGLFGVNYIQSALHLIAGLFGLYVGIKGIGPGYNATLGWIAIALGVIGFIPGIGYGTGLLGSLLNIDLNITILHLVIGIVTLGVYYGADKK